MSLSNKMAWLLVRILFVHGLAASCLQSLRLHCIPTLAHSSTE